MKKTSMVFPMNLQYFAESTDQSDNQTSAETKNTDSQNTDTTAGQQQNKKPDGDIMIPKSRFDEVNNKYKDVQSKLEELLKEKQEREKAEAEKRGEFEKLYQQATEEAKTHKQKVEAFEQRVQQLEGVIQQLLETKLEAIPEEFRDLIPSNFTVEQKLEWIANAEKKGLFTKKQQQQIGGDTNSSDKQAIDLTALSPIQLLKAGYGSKK